MIDTATRSDITVMPFEGIDPWTKTETPDGRITFRPSVGNNQMPCRSGGPLMAWYSVETPSIAIQAASMPRMSLG